MRRFLVLLALAAVSLPGQKRPFDVDGMLRIQRISEPQLSPDGKLVAFTVQTVDLAQNTKPKQIWMVRMDGASPAWPVTREGSNERPRWTPDGKRIVFISTRGGSSQVWSMDPEGGRLQQTTNLSTEASGVIVSPDGKRIIFISSVYPECPDDACNKSRLDAESAAKVKARVYTSLLYRHWNQFQGKRRSHLMSSTIDGGELKDLTPGNRDVPPFSLAGTEEYAISPDGGEVAYTVNMEDAQALSTNSDIYVVPITGGESKRVTTNPAADNTPLYSPDGKFLAFRSQQRPGYESDRWRLIVLERATGLNTAITDGVDRNVTAFTWTPDAKKLFIVTEDRGRHNVQQLSVTGGALKPIITGPTSIDDVQFTPDAKTILYSEMSGSKPVELYKASSGGSGVPLTHLNDDLLSAYSLRPLEEIWVNGAEQARVHSFVAKPADFDPKKKYPILFLIHGGPQGEWGESWSYRWNPQIFASAGYVVVMPNPRGSTGYGQKFTDDINQDWGGKVYEDIMATVDKVASEPWADGDRMAAAGGSYGGYMVDWMLGHTNRFRALVTHAGVYDLRSMAAETEELWFPMWEFKGMPWENPEVYEKWSPSMFVREFKTPTLVMHGELDYRVPVGQGMQLFTGLQMQKVPSKMVLFPDEGHWILKPQNTMLWYRSFLDWVGEWTKKPTISQ
jgi:dipeptidyl aminopeptidase/acylaminoacyl peptidase